MDKAIVIASVFALGFVVGLTVADRREPATEKRPAVSRPTMTGTVYWPYGRAAVRANVPWRKHHEISR